MTSAPKDEFELEEAVRLLAATPNTLHSLLGDLPESWLEFQEDPDAWSPRTVLVHYIHNELTNWMPRVRVTLSEAEVRQFAPFPQMPDLSEYEAFDVLQLLSRFADLRRENLVELQSLKLGPEDFTRQAEHPVLGTVNMRQLLSAWVAHDLNHLHQITKTLAKRYLEEIGPWREYLLIVDL